MEMENDVVKVIPIGSARFSGLRSLPNTFTTIGCELGPSGYKTGLTKDEQKFFEEKLGLKSGDLSPASEWWGSLEIRLANDKATYFNTQDTMNKLKVKVLMASSKICNSPREKFNWPKAEFMVDNEQIEAELLSVQIDTKFEAMKALMETTPEEKRGFLRLYGKRGVTDMREVMVKAELAKKVEENPAKFLELINDKQLKTRFLLEELLEEGFITRHGNYYKNGDDPIGNSTEEVLGYLEDPKHNAIRAALTSKLRAKRKGQFVKKEVASVKQDDNKIEE